MKNYQRLFVLAALISGMLLSACDLEYSFGHKGCRVFYDATFENSADASFSWVVRLKAHDAESGESLGQSTFIRSIGPLTTETYNGDFHLNYAPPSGRAIIVMFVNGDRWEKTEVEIDSEDCWEDPTWTFSVDQMSTTVPEASVPSPDGTLACGLFDVMTHGEKVVDLSLYPDCPADPTVYCMDGAGAWTASNVSDLMISEDGILSFTSGQEGLCGLFSMP